MQVYLPIAEVSVNAFLLLGLGGLVGVLSGMFGVGGGFLMTPLLFFIGIPPAVAVATEANQIVASSFSGVLAHLRRKTVDFRMGTVLLIGVFALHLGPQGDLPDLSAAEARGVVANATAVDVQAVARDLLRRQRRRHGRHVRKGF